MLASYGHVRDLPAKDGSVNPDDGFAMEWENYADKAKQLKAITDLAKTGRPADPGDRSRPRGRGDLAGTCRRCCAKRKALPKEVERVTFNAITKPAVTEAMKRPRELDTDLIDAYQARRALDYLVGFTLSPVLWRKLPGAKSAGRVQSVSLRLIVEREREIEAFRAQEYWSVTADAGAGRHAVQRAADAVGGQEARPAVDRRRRRRAKRAKADVEAGAFTVQSVETKPATRNPPPPFTTSTLQQEAARKLGFSADHTMRIAQGLYEDGAITYMRTDGVQMDGIGDLGGAQGGRRPLRRAATSPTSRANTRPRPRTRRKRTRRSGRPISRKDKVGGGDHARLYDLIWKRALASQMASARMERTTVDLADGTGRHVLRATGQVVLFPGYLALYEEGRDDERRRGRAAACRACARAMRPPRRASTPSSISPSRRRAFPKRRWSSGWRSSASAARRPTPRSSRR